jgi:hypothetical protein
MKKGLLFLLILFSALTLQAQKGNESGMSAPASEFSRSANHVNVTIFPVPVRENNFTIKSDKEISSVKITNIIGQDILRIKYNDPQQEIKVFLDNQKRGMYLVTILFSDETRVVKKIMIEESK